MMVLVVLSIYLKVVYTKNSLMGDSLIFYPQIILPLDNTVEFALLATFPSS